MCEEFCGRPTPHLVIDVRNAMSMRPKDDSKMRRVPRYEPEDLPTSGIVTINPYSCVGCGIAYALENSVQARGDQQMRCNDCEARDSLSRLTQQTGGAADKEDLRTFLEGYMGDPVFAARFADCIDMLRRKNADYSQGEQKGDRIAAFRRIARDINITMVQAWAVFCQKHWGAVMKYVKDQTVESEPLDGRINDIINYMVLLGAIIDDERGPK